MWVLRVSDYCTTLVEKNTSSSIYIVPPNVAYQLATSELTAAYMLEPRVHIKPKCLFEGSIYDCSCTVY